MWLPSKLKEQLCSPHGNLYKIECIEFKENQTKIKSTTKNTWDINDIYLEKLFMVYTHMH